MFLIGDIGNTEVKIVLFNKKNIILKKILLKTDKINENYISKKIKFNKKLMNGIEKILFSSVVPSVFFKFKYFFKRKFKKKCYELKDLKLDKIIKVKVNKKQIGSDRLANSLAVINKRKNFIIVDFGTATTFDVVVKDIYLGGVIAPGVHLSLNTLSSKAKLIPKISLSKNSNVIGRNTISAVRSGFYWGYAGLIENIIKLISKQSKKSYKIIFTGGYSSLFQNSINVKASIKKDLTIQGLLKVIKYIK